MGDRLLISIMLLTAVLLTASGCGGERASHEVPVSRSPAGAPADADAVTKPPRAIATH